MHHGITLAYFCIIQCICTIPSAFIALKHNNVHKTRFQREITRFSALTSFLLKNQFKRRETLFQRQLAFFCIFQCICTIPSAFIALKHNNVHKTRSQREITRFCSLTSFLLKNSFKRIEMLVLALASLFLHNSMHLHHSFFLAFIALKHDNVHKTVFCAK